jgi:putative membrane protein
VKGIFLRWAANTAAIWIAAQLIPGIEVRGLKGAIVAAAVLGILNALIRPLLLLLTLPLTVLTLGLSTLLINGLLLILTSKITSGLLVQGFWPAVWGALVISLLSSLLSWFLD